MQARPMYDGFFRIDRNELMQIIAKGSERVQETMYAHYRYFANATDQKNRLPSERGLVDQFLIETETSSKNDRASAEWDYTPYERELGSDFHVSWTPVRTPQQDQELLLEQKERQHGQMQEDKKTRKISTDGVKKTMFFQAKNVKYSTKQRIPYADFLYESGAKKNIQFQAELLASTVGKEVEAGREADAYYILFDRHTVRFANANLLWQWQKTNIPDYKGVDKPSMRAWNSIMFRNLTDTDLNAADRAGVRTLENIIDHAKDLGGMDYMLNYLYERQRGNKPQWDRGEEDLEDAGDESD